MSTPITRVVMLRHGRTTWNAERRMQGRLDPPLDETGEAQAAAVAPLVAAFAPTVMICSDQTRAAQTAAAVAEVVGLEPRKEPRLRETDVGRWEGLVAADVEAGWPGGLAEWGASARFRPPGGESRVDVAERALPVLHELVEGSRSDEMGAPVDGATALIVAHGGTIIGLTSGFLELPVEHWHALAPLGNCRWATLDLRLDRWRLAEWNAGVP